MGGRAKRTSRAWAGTIKTGGVDRPVVGRDTITLCPTTVLSVRMGRMLAADEAQRTNVHGGIILHKR
ncbi:hypothetical protein PPGU19_089660 (plasmid) [Paraburkholderia sp. PGU19]|uniref:Uncharacterized protein n=1 Tax=Paraburkholderia terrae TaxID=311230 RepID=A0ABN6JV39_9BURK|nr:hypothetical protein PPGU19_089660 [Paraburkholderia sp. PGU19]BCZ84836.1 hypothetical protein PTKU64_85110 [Paraburkholderia terrae]BDC44809.1 hypothetical protein PTKU15_81060 [Paraburkholderia terrae]